MHWSTGVLEHWGSGALGYWSTGALRLWSSGALELSSSSKKGLGPAPGTGSREAVVAEWTFVRHYWTNAQYYGLWRRFLTYMFRWTKSLEKVLKKGLKKVNSLKKALKRVMN